MNVKLWSRRGAAGMAAVVLAGAGLLAGCQSYQGTSVSEPDRSWESGSWGNNRSIDQDTRTRMELYTGNSGETAPE